MDREEKGKKKEKEKKQQQMAPPKKKRQPPSDDLDPLPASPFEPKEVFHHLTGDGDGVADVSDSDEGGASDFILKPIPPSKRSQNSRKKDEMDAAEAEEVKKGRIWSHGDELAVLRGIIRYKSKNGGADPRKDPAAFHEFVKPSLQFDASKKQVSDKIKKLKRRFYSKLEVDPVDHGDASDHQRLCIGLANQIWGPPPPAAASPYQEENNDNDDKSDDVAAATVTATRSTKKKKNECVAVEVDQENKDALILEEKFSGGEMIPPPPSARAEEADAGNSKNKKVKKGKQTAAAVDQENKEKKAKEKKKSKDKEELSDYEREKEKEKESDSSGDEMIPEPPATRKDTASIRKSKKLKKRKRAAVDREATQDTDEIQSLPSAEDSAAVAPPTNRSRTRVKNNMSESAQVDKPKEIEEEDKETPGDDKVDKEEPSFKVEDFWHRYPNLKESMETGMFGSIVSVGEWLRSTTVGIEKAKELEQKWMGLQKAEIELFGKYMQLIEEEIGGILSKAADS